MDYLIRNPPAKRKGICDKSQNLLLLDSVNADTLAVAAVALKANLTVDCCKQGIIGADADIVTRMDMGTALTDKDVAREDILTVAALYAKALCFGITAVLCRTDALFMRKELHADTQHLKCTSVFVR